MSFNSVEFFGFLAAALAVFWILPHRVRLGFLLAASYAFYATTDWRFLGLIVASTAVDYVVGLSLGKTDHDGQRRALLVISIVVNLLILALFKYFNFFTDSFANVADAIGMSAPRWSLQVILPIGLSFYTFQSLSYSIDVYRRDIEPERSPVVMATFVAFFPQLLAGPIERSSKLMPQLRELPYRIGGAKVLEAFELIVIGLFKKVAVADVVFRVVVDGFSPEAGLFAQGGDEKTWILTVLTMVAFGLQQYCDFSGYSDIARGVAKLFGVELSRNFLRPKQSGSFAEFWQRWHVTFMRWMRDYLFRPLEAQGSGTVRSALNLMIVFGLVGLWHGARWPAVVWGLAIGLMVAGETAFFAARRQAKIKHRLPGQRPGLTPGATKRFKVAPIFVIGLLLVTLPLQVLPDWDAVGDFYGRLFRFETGPTPWDHMIAVGYAAICIYFIDKHQATFERDEDRRRIALGRLEQSAKAQGVAPSPDVVAQVGSVQALSGWAWQFRTGAMIALIALFGSNAIAAEFYYFQF